jgi:hypothetical protein
MVFIPSTGNRKKGGVIGSLTPKVIGPSLPDSPGAWDFSHGMALVQSLGKSKNSGYFRQSALRHRCTYEF